MTAQLFKFIRQSHGLTQDEYARELGISRALVSLIELESKPVSNRTKSKLYRKYGDDFIESCRQFLNVKGVSAE